MSEGQEQKVTVVTPTKSMGISILLTFLFGPLGMLYSTIMGAVVMGIISLPVGFFTAGLGLIVTWPICVIWGAVATSGYNKRLIAAATA